MTRLIGALLVALIAAGCVFEGEATPSPRPACPTGPPSRNGAQAALTDASAVVIDTNKGALTVELDPSSAPIATANVVALARCGFYDGITFHRVIAGFVAQAGDPATKTNRGDFPGLGTGNPGYRFEVELPPAETVYTTYTVAMANGLQYDPNTLEITSGTDTNGSQFFIALADLPLPPFYSVIGRVTDGTDTVDAIGQVPVNGPAGMPLDPVIIETMTVESGPAASPAAG